MESITIAPHKAAISAIAPIFFATAFPRSLLHHHARSFASSSPQMIDPFIEQRANSLQKFESRLAEVLGNLLGSASSPKKPAERAASFAADTATLGMPRFFTHIEPFISTTNTSFSICADAGVGRSLKWGGRYADAVLPLL